MSSSESVVNVIAPTKSLGEQPLSPRRIPNIFTLWAGMGIFFAGIWQTLASLSFSFTLSDSYALPFHSTVPSVIMSFITAAAFTVLAIGVRGERSIVGTSLAGKIALIVFGVRVLIFIGLFFAINSSVTEGPGWDGIYVALLLGGVSNAVVLAAAIVAAISVVRAAVLGRFARWAFFALAVWQGITAVSSYIPSAQFGLLLAQTQFSTLGPLIMIAFGAGCIVHGRAGAIRARLRIISENW